MLSGVSGLRSQLTGVGGGTARLWSPAIINGVNWAGDYPAWVTDYFAWGS